MKEFKLKGLAIDKEVIVIFIVIFIVFLIGLTFFLGIWNISVPTILNQSNIQAECTKWQSSGDKPCSEGLDATKEGEPKYPALKEKYGVDLDMAREFCNCPD